MGFLDAIEDTRDRVDEVLDVYDDSSDPEFETFVIGYPYIYWEQYLTSFEVLGFLPLLNLEVNAFSSTNVILSLGMSIEFTSHIAHEFLVEQGEERADRIVRALRFMGQPMLHGAVSSILAVLFIAGSQTPFLRNFI